MVTPAPVELQLKIAGPSEIRYNEPAHFRCSATRSDAELSLSLNQNYIKSAQGVGEFSLKPGHLEHGTRQFILECYALDENNDKITISHVVNVLCKFVLWFLAFVFN